MLKLLSLFSGIGGFEKALNNLEVLYELVNFCEIDKYAVKSYCAIHGVDESKNLGDITHVDEKVIDRDIDILTYGFPCQDISISGQQKGLFNSDGTLTRSGLFFEALRIIEHTQPKIAIAENVKNLVGKKFNAQFQVVLASLESAGYNNYWKVLNSKDFGVPQNRERVFIVSIRKDIDTGKFEFPEPYPLEKRLKDVLEDVVDEKYYLSEKALVGLVTRYSDNPKKRFKFRTGEDIAATVDSGVGIKANINFIIEEPTIMQIGQMYPNSGNPQAGRIYDADGLSPALDTCSGGNRMPKVAVAMRGRLNGHGKWHQEVEVSDREYANAITTVQKDSLIADGERIRKLTPKECFRLMGFDDESFHKAEAVNSNTQLYKQAGNSIVVDVLEELFCMMLDENGHLYV